MTDAQLKALARGRQIGASAGGKAVSKKPAPADCAHCRMFGYTSWMSHLGHLAARKLLDEHPEAISMVKEIIARRKHERDNVGRSG